jgi:hypothetical protein
LEESVGGERGKGKDMSDEKDRRMLHISIWKQHNETHQTIWKRGEEREEMGISWRRWTTSPCMDLSQQNLLILLVYDKSKNKKDWSRIQAPWCSEFVKLPILAKILWCQQWIISRDLPIKFIDWLIHSVFIVHLLYIKYCASIGYTVVKKKVGPFCSHDWGSYSVSWVVLRQLVGWSERPGSAG